MNPDCRCSAGRPIGFTHLKQTNTAETTTLRSGQVLSNVPGEVIAPSDHLEAIRFRSARLHLKIDIRA